MDANDNKVILNHKEWRSKFGSHLLGTRLIPSSDVCTALSVDSIGSYHAPSQFRKLNQSIDLIRSIPINKTTKDKQLCEAKEEVNLQLTPPMSPIEQCKMLHAKHSKTTFQEEDIAIYCKLLEQIDDEMLPGLDDKLKEKNYLLIERKLDKNLLEHNYSHQVIEEILENAEMDYKLANKQSIIDYVIMNKDVAQRFNLEGKSRKHKSIIIRSPTGWHESFIQAQSFHQKYNLICHPIIIEIMRLWNTRFSGATIVDFQSETCVNVESFKSSISINCHKLRSMLLYDCVSACSQIILQMDSNLINLDSVKEPALFETIGVIMARLIRQLILRNIESWCELIERCSLNKTPYFNISLENEANKITFKPPIEDWREIMLFPIKEIIKANEKIPRIEKQLILMKPKDYETKYVTNVTQDDHEIGLLVNRIDKVLELEYNCKSILNSYQNDFLTSDFSSKKETYRYYAIGEIRRIKLKGDQIRLRIISEPHFFESGLFNIDCKRLFAYFSEKIHNRINSLIENKVNEVLLLARHVCDLFLKMEKNIEKRSESTTVLVEQIQQLDDYQSTLYNIIKDIEFVEEHWTFLTEEGAFVMNEADLDLLHQLHNWSGRITAICETNQIRFAERKEEADKMLREKIAAFENNLHDLERTLNEFKKKRLASPLESIIDNVRALEEIEKQLMAAEIEREEINSEEKLLGWPKITQFKLLEELIKRKIPLDNIWKTARMFEDKEKEWMQKSLKSLNVIEVKDSVDNLLKTAVKLKTAAALTQSCQTQTDLLQNANTLHSRIDEFKRKFIPLLQVLCNPLLRARHWRKMSQIIGQNVTEESVPTLTHVIKLTNVSSHISELENLGNIAMKEHALEAFLEKLKNEWMEDWPQDALDIAANKFLEGENLEIEVKEKCAEAFKYIHENSRKFIAEFINKNSDLAVYITPTLFIEFILTFKDLLRKKQREMFRQQTRYMGGVEKLDLAASHVDLMKNMLINEFQPQLVIASNETELLMIKIEKETLLIETKKETIAADESIANRSAAISQQIKDECTRDLAEAVPAIRSAIQALNTLKAEDIVFLKAVKNPPVGVKMVLESVCILKGIQPDRKLDPEGSGKLIDDYWSSALRMISSEIKFLENLKQFDRDHISREAITLVRERYLHSQEFDSNQLKKVSLACEGLAKWVKAIDIYDKVIHVVKPKKKKLEEAEKELSVVMERLDEKKHELQETSDKLQQLNDEFAAMSKKKKDLEENIAFCSLKLARAEQLIQGLESEKTRWRKAAFELSTQHENIVGDILLSASTIVYTSALNAHFRQLCLNRWQNYLKDQCKMSFTEPFSIINALGIPIDMQTWTLAGLSSDQYSSENAIIVQNTKRCPFIIDPNQVANKWIKRLYPNISVIHYNGIKYQNFKTTLLRAISDGKITLIENVDQESLNQVLIQVLKKELVLQDGVQHINIANQLTQYSPQFKLYITTQEKLHLSPLNASRVTLVNWCLDDSQTIHYHADSEKARQLRARAEKEKQLIELEDEILQVLSTAETNVLEDENAIMMLVNYKELAQQVAEI